MQEELYKKLLQTSKDLYFGLGAIPGVCMDNQLIHFNQDGFRHILRRGRKIRPIEDQIRRFNLLKYVKEVLSSQDTSVSPSENRGKNTKMNFWTLHKKVSSSKTVKIVIGKLGTGSMHFVSIMDE